MRTTALARLQCHQCPQLSFNDVFGLTEHSSRFGHAVSFDPEAPEVTPPPTPRAALPTPERSEVGHSSQSGVGVGLGGVSVNPQPIQQKETPVSKDDIADADGHRILGRTEAGTPNVQGGARPILWVEQQEDDDDDDEDDD